MVGATGSRSWASRVMREPTLHFVLLALALYGVNSGLRTLGGGDVVEIDRGRLSARIAQVEATVGGPLNAEERRRVEADYVDIEILAQEARTLGLDEDLQVHELLAQKMLDVLSAEAVRPTREELEAYHRSHLDRYVIPRTVTLDELVVRTSDSLSEALRKQLARGTPPDRLEADVALEGGQLALMTRADLVRIFGEETAELIMEGPVGSWVGPHDTVRGQHWFRVTKRTEDVAPTLDSVFHRVRLDWVADNERERLDSRVADLRARWTVVFVGEERGR